MSRTIFLRTLVIGLLLLGGTMAAAPAASAERITGCADGWHVGDDDCALGDYDLGPDCVSIRECGPPS